MIRQLKLRNFRNFWSKEFFFEKGINGIYGNNGLGKSNIIEALSLLSWGELFWLEFDDLVKEGETGFFIEITLTSGEEIALSYEKSIKKKRISVKGKPTTKPKFKEATFASVSFHPLTLNMMYLAPTLRREYIDSILAQTYDTYSTIYKNYKEVLRSRNKLLQSIQEGKSQRSEIQFWNQKFIDLAEKIYEFRDKYIEYVQQEMPCYQFLLWEKITTLSFIYKSKINASTRRSDIDDYLKKNLERDIILGTTPIWPHVDDFDIEVDGKSITSFASRWETKSIILGLKMIEAKFIEKENGKKPIILIDDFLSEIDDTHKNYVFSTFSWYQTIITSIVLIQWENQINSIIL